MFVIEKVLQVRVEMPSGVVEAAQSPQAGELFEDIFHVVCRIEGHVNGYVLGLQRIQLKRKGLLDCWPWLFRALAAAAAVLCVKTIGALLRVGFRRI